MKIKKETLITNLLQAMGRWEEIQKKPKNFYMIEFFFLVDML